MNEITQDRVPRESQTASGRRGGFVPILKGAYAPGEEHHIDALQHSWSQKLMASIPELEDARLFDVLLCTREILLNALKHGCQQHQGSVATLAISWNSSARIIRVTIEDPGQGHAFDRKQHAESEDAMLTAQHRGLLVAVKHATRFETDGMGSWVEMDFSFEGVTRALAS